MIADYSFDKKCEIYKVNHKPVGFTKSDAKNLDLINTKLTKLYQDFFLLSIKPLLPKNYEIKWQEIHINNKPLEDIPKYSKLYNRINYICYSFLNILGRVKYNDFKPEVRYIENYTRYVLAEIDIKD